MTAPRFVLYTRVSTQAQDSNNSHPTQLAALEAYAAKRGGEVVEVIRETASGAGYLRRPGIRRAIDLLERDEADSLVCYDFSRYSRDGEHQQAMLRRVEQIGKRIEFTTLELARDEDGQLTPEGQLMFTVSGGFAEYHRLKIKADSVRGTLNAARNGQQPSRRFAPYGYRIVHNAEVKAGLEPPEELGKYRIVEEQAAIVRDIFALRAAGTSTADIAQQLNERGIPTPRGGVRWHESTIKTILSARCYYGEASWRQTRSITDERRLEAGLKSARRLMRRPDSERIVIPCPPIVTRQEWDAAKSTTRALKRSVNARNTKGLLTGLLRCPRCGAGMVHIYQPRLKAGLQPITYKRGEKPQGRQPRDPSRLEQHPAYVCSNAVRPRDVRARGDEPCPRVPYPAFDIEKRVRSSLRRALSAPSFAQSIAGESRAQESAELKSLKAQIAELQQKRKTIVAAQVRALSLDIDPTAHEELLGEVSSQLRELSARLDALSGASPTSRAHLIEVANKLAQALEADTPALGNLLGTLVERIEWNPDTKTTKIHFV